MPTRSRVKYQPVTQREGGESESLERSSRWSSKGYSFYIVVAVLICSLGLNAATFLDRSLGRCPRDIAPVSQFAGLMYEKPLKWSRKTPWHTGNRTEDDIAWLEAPGFGHQGVVALSDQYVASKGLPKAMRWPWDKTKGVYVVESFHILHCIAGLRRTLLAARDGKPLPEPFDHLYHCVDSIRQFTMCHADDTPRYKGRLGSEIHQAIPHAGMGQERICRDWSKLVTWMDENSACYSPVPKPGPAFKEEDNYKSCPDGSVHWI